MFKGMALPGRGISWKEFFKRLASEYNRDNIGNVAAALTYFGVQALFPFLLSAVIAVGGVALAKAVHGPLGTAIDILRFPVAGVLMMLLWALLYYFGPDVEQRFKFITPGSIVGVFLWVIASIGFSVYVGK